MMINIGVSSLFCVIVLIAVFSDIKRLIIPNWISLTLVVGFLVTRPLISMPWSDVGLNLACGFIFFAVGYLLFLLRLIGGGDVKLLAAVTVWIGFGSALPFILLMSLIGTMVALLWSVRTFIYHHGVPLAERLRLVMKTEIPYGVAIGLAAIFTVATDVLGGRAL